MLRKTANAFVLLSLLVVLGCNHTAPKAPKVEVAANQPCRAMGEKTTAVLERHTGNTGPEMGPRQLADLTAKMKDDPALKALLRCLMQQ